MLYENIKKILKEKDISFDEIEHGESQSCEDSKRFRSEACLDGIGSKNIVFHAKGEYYLVTTIGDKEIKARRFKKEFGTKDIRFAYQDEITNLLGATIGSIPPFGFQNKTIKIFVDKVIFDSEYFMFNPGISTKTIRVKTSDLLEIYKSLKNEIKIFDFSLEEASFEELIK
ncbi:MAG: YbaK/EbsC family protein [Candidatus Gracilibacteria bacterium]|nr:YbaK/EbsC family protein [Candidatus Gracilibacteria bacterium]